MLNAVNSNKRANGSQPSFQSKYGHNIKEKGLQGIIFDVDDTMVNSMHAHFEAWVKLLLKHNPKNLTLDYSAGVSPKNFELVKNAYRGGSSEDFITQLYGGVSANSAKALADERSNIFCEGIGNLKEVCGISKFLESCTTIKKAIATSTSKEVVTKVLEHLNIAGHFEDKRIIDPSRYTKCKPDPEPFLNAAKELKVAPHNCLVFEDSAGGIQSAKGAGMKVIGVATGMSKNDLLKLGVARAINDYNDIKNLSELEQLFK